VTVACAPDQPQASSPSPKAPPPPPPDTKSILIVGAGVAGLAAARSLTDGGWPVRVIEARDRSAAGVHQPGLGRPDRDGRILDSRHGERSGDGTGAEGRAQLVSTDYDGWAKLAVDPKLQPLDYDKEIWPKFVEQACGRVDGGSLAAALNAAAAREQLSRSDRVQLAFYVATEIEDEYAATADQLSAKTFDKGDYATGGQDVIINGYDALPKLLADRLQIVLNTTVTAVARQDSQSSCEPETNHSKDPPRSSPFRSEC